MSLIIPTDAHTHLSVLERAMELTRLFGFNQSILAGSLSPSSQYIYCRDFYAYLTFAGSRDTALRPETLARWIVHLSTINKPGSTQGYSPKTINRMASAIRKLMKAAGMQGYIDPATAEAFLKVDGVREEALKENLRQHNRVALKDDQMRTLVEMQREDRERLLIKRDRAMLLTLATSGLRVTAFSRLRVDQIVANGKHYEISVRDKNDKHFRAAPLSNEAYEAIQEWLIARPVSSAYLFTHFDGGRSDAAHVRLSAAPISAQHIRKILKHYAEAIQLPHIKPHDFRRFLGTKLAQSDIIQAQRALGHKRSSTTLDNYVLQELRPGVSNDLF